MADERDEWQGIRRAVTNIIGFHALSERDDLTQVQRIQYEAQVYAGGVDLARRIARAMAQEDGPGSNP